MSAHELLAKARAAKPHIRYTINRRGDAIAAWDDRLGRWVAVAAYTILGRWISVEHELLVNGAPVFGDWIESA